MWCCRAIFDIGTIEAWTAISFDHVNVYIYVDDLAIVSESKEDLQTALDELTDWFDTNDLQINR